MPDFRPLAAQCQHALLEQCLPFWLKYACDGLGGGYFEYLAADGSTLEANKTVARQAEQVWAFAWLYTTLDAQPDWLDHALHGADFLAEHAHDSQLACYTTLDRLGNPIALMQQPLTHDPLTTARVAAAYAQMHLATGHDEWARLAKQTFQTLLVPYQTHRHTRLVAPPTQPQPLKPLSQPVAVLRALLDSQHLFTPADWKEATEPLLDELLTDFLDRRHDQFREFVGPGGAFSNTPEGRRLHTNLSVQAAAVVLETGAKLGNRKLVQQATNWVLALCERTWPTAPARPNRLAGPPVLVQGLPHYTDSKGQPMPFAEAGQRHAATHALALAMLANGYRHTRHSNVPDWLERLCQYTFQHFPATEPSYPWHPILPPTDPFVATPSTGCYGLIRGLAETRHYLTLCQQPEPHVPPRRSLA